MQAKVVLNPYASRWEAGRRQSDVEAALSAAGVEFETALSSQRGHCTELAAQAVRQGYSPIIAAGGDGTIGEVVNGIVQATGTNNPPPMGILPLGTANDTVVNLGLPTDLDGAARVLAAGKTRPIDILQVNDRYFINNSGIGLEPYVTVIQQDMTRVKGIFRYLLATLVAIARNPQWNMRLQWDGGSYDGPCTLVSVGNSPLTGGVFYTVPHADPYDGQLTFVHGYLSSRLKILAVLPKTMKASEGNYVEHPAVHEFHTTRLKVHVEPASPAHADGELFSYAIQDLEYIVHPGKLPLLI